MQGLCLHSVLLDRKLVFIYFVPVHKQVISSLRHSIGYTSHMINTEYSIQNPIVTTAHIPLSRAKRRILWQCRTLAAVSLCCSWCIAWNRCCLNAIRFVAGWSRVPDRVPNFCFSNSELSCRDSNASRTAGKSFCASCVPEWTHILLVNTPY
jgi:hypothetical protein